MKKLTSFILGLLILLPLMANNYEKNETTGMYDYIGTDSVAFVDLDFTKNWKASDLYDENIGTDYGTKDHTLSFKDTLNYGFQKCIIYPNRWLYTGTNKNALFNNGRNGADSLTQMAIYFPPVKYGVKQITLVGYKSGRPLIVLGYNESTLAWEKLGTLAMPTAYDTCYFDVNRTDVNRVAIYTDKTDGNVYTTITNILISAMEQPEEPLYNLVDAENHIYEYTGAAVDAINVNFADWATSNLPAQLTDDMELSQKDNLGFVKWKIENNKGIGQNVLFNNNTNDAGVTIANNDANQKNPPRIYFPTTVRGIDSIEIKCYVGSDVMLEAVYSDNTHTNDTVELTLPGSSNNEPKKFAWHLNSVGQTKVYFQYRRTAWPRILSIDFTLVDDSPTSLSETEADTRVIKRIENGQLVIIKNGVRYNILGSNF